MAIEVKCPACSRVFRVPDGTEGKKCACPHCSAFIVVARPRLAESAAQPDEPPWNPDDVFPIFAGHTGAITSVDTSVGGSIAISSGEDGSVRFWDFDTGRETFRLEEGHEGAVTCAALSRDGTFAASGGADGTVRLWHTVKARCVRVLEGHKGPVTGVAFYPLGGYVYSASKDGTARMWEMATGKCPRVLKGHKGAVASVAVDPEGRAAMTAGADGTVRLWRCDKGKQVARLTGHRGPVHCAAFNSDGALVISGGEDRTAVIWSVKLEKPLKVLKGHQAGVRAASLSSDNSTAATVGADWALKIWDVDSGKAVVTLDEEDQRVTTVVVHPAAECVIAGYSGGAVRAWHSKTGKLIRAFGGTEHSVGTRCPSCRKVFAMAGKLLGHRGLCPFCRVRFSAHPYSPSKSAEAVKRGLAEMAANHLPRAQKEFDEAIRFQGDNHQAILNAIVCRNRLGTGAYEGALYAEALAILDEAVRLYFGNPSWPLELHVQATAEGYAAAFLAGKICRFHLSDPSRAAEYLRLAQNLNNTLEVQDMLMHLERGRVPEST